MHYSALLFFSSSFLFFNLRSTKKGRRRKGNAAKKKSPFSSSTESWLTPSLLPSFSSIHPAHTQKGKGSCSHAAPAAASSPNPLQRYSACEVSQGRGVSKARVSGLGWGNELLLAVAVQHTYRGSNTKEGTRTHSHAPPPPPLGFHVRKHSRINPHPSPLPSSSFFLTLPPLHPLGSGKRTMGQFSTSMDPNGGTRETLEGIFSENSPSLLSFSGGFSSTKNFFF